MNTQTYTLQAEQRETFGKKVSALRDQSRIPAVVYGPGTENVNISLGLQEFEKVYRAAGESTLIDLVVAGGQPVKILIHDIQRDALSNKAVHADLYRVNMKEKLTTHVAFEFVGESKAVKEKGGILVKNISEVEIRCLPTDLVSEIEIDLTPLADLESVIRVKDIALPKGLELMHQDLEDIIAIVTPPVSEEELRKMEEEGSVKAPTEAPVSAEKGKKEAE